MQQKSSVLPAGHPVKALQGLARQIALPHEYAPQRFPSFPALERTAVMGFNAPAQVDLPASTPVKFMVTRQASYPVWADRTISSCGYRVEFASDTNSQNVGSDTTLFHNYGPFQEFGVTVQAASTTRVGTDATCFGGYPFTAPPLGVDSRSGGSNPFVYVPPNWQVLVVMSGNGGPFGTAAHTGVVNFELWTAPGETTRFIQAVANHTTGQYSLWNRIPAQSGGRWIRPTTSSISIGGATGYNWPDSVSVTLLVSSVTMELQNSDVTWGLARAVSGTNPNLPGFLPLVQPAEFYNSSLPWMATRTTASSLLLTNVSQVLTKAGTVLAGRISPNVISPWVVSADYINNLHPAEKAFLPLETGFYTYCPPSTDMAEFWDYSSVTNSGFVSTQSPGNPYPVYRLDNDAMVNVAFLTAGATAEQVAANVDWHIEFRTSSALFQVGLCGMTLETLHQAQLVLAMSGFFFENSWHKRLLEKIVAGAKSIAPMAYTALRAVNPAAASVVHSAYMLTQKPRTSIPATSAAASGITRTPRAAKKKKNVRVARSGKKKK